jgi:hypothetical protein
MGGGHRLHEAAKRGAVSDHAVAPKLLAVAAVGEHARRDAACDRANDAHDTHGTHDQRCSLCVIATAMLHHVADDARRGRCPPLPSTGCERARHMRRLEQVGAAVADDRALAPRGRGRGR